MVHSELCTALPHAAHKVGACVRRPTVGGCSQCKEWKSGSLLPGAQCTHCCCPLCAQRQLADGQALPAQEPRRDTPAHAHTVLVRFVQHDALHTLHTAAFIALILLLTGAHFCALAPPAQRLTARPCGPASVTGLRKKALVHLEHFQLFLHAHLRASGECNTGKNRQKSCAGC